MQNNAREYKNENKAIVKNPRINTEQWSQNRKLIQNNCRENINKYKALIINMGIQAKSW